MRERRLVISKERSDREIPFVRARDARESRHLEGAQRLRDPLRPGESVASRPGISPPFGRRDDNSPNRKLKTANPKLQTHNPPRGTSPARLRAGGIAMHHQETSTPWWRRENVGTVERWISIAAGTGLILNAIQRRSPGAITGALAGAALLYRVNPGPWNRP